jgi:hypothetical protein
MLVMRAAVATRTDMEAAREKECVMPQGMRTGVLI